MKQELEKKIEETKTKMDQAAAQVNDLTKQIFILEGMMRGYKEILESMK